VKAVDGWIAVIGIVALILAALVVLRARQATQASDARMRPSATAPAPADTDFPACMSRPQGISRWRCQVAQARREQRIRCYGQRLYYVMQTRQGKQQYAPWPEDLKCWNSTESENP